uniref:BHLH domain-containing protein n=1 Tax=Callorhinchus milii TaxID=7868 RepID=A0A4W3HA26_CALMI
MRSPVWTRKMTIGTKGRERQRVHGVNVAFQDLRRLLPVLTDTEVSKTDILKLAAKWIAHLSTVLLLDDQRRQQREHGQLLVYIFGNILQHEDGPSPYQDCSFWFIIRGF